MSHSMEAVPADGLTTAERAAVGTFYRAIAENRPDLLDAAVAEDWEDIPLAPDQAPGREGMKPLIAGVAAAFADFRIIVHEVIGAPGRAAVRGEMTGTHTGAWFGVPPTGRAFRIALHEFHRIEDGHLTHTWHLEDWFGWLGQVGGWPPGIEGAGKEAA